jgi:hypothetical protein
LACGLRAATDKIAVDSAWRLEHRKDVADRITYLSRQDEEVIKPSGCGSRKAYGIK